MENAVVLREWFDCVDAGRTGNITAPELQSALAVGNLDFPLPVVQQMIRMYDFDRNGTMNFEEFLALSKFLQKVQSVFSTLERGRGFLGLEEVYEALIKLGFSLDSPAFYTVCESFDKSNKGMVRLDEFISLCIFVQSARLLLDVLAVVVTRIQLCLILLFFQRLCCCCHDAPIAWTLVRNISTMESISTAILVFSLNSKEHFVNAVP